MARTAKAIDESLNGNGAAETETNSTATTSTSKRQGKASVTYLMPDGSERNFPDALSSVIRFEVIDGTKRDFDVSYLSETVKHCALLQGVVTRFQRGYQALKEIDKVVASIDDTSADLNDGIWIEVGNGEPRVTNLIAAIVMGLEAKGQTVDANRKREIGEKLAADENLRKETRERPAIAAYLATLSRQASEKREAEKLKLAQASGEDGTEGF